MVRAISEDLRSRVIAAVAGGVAFHLIMRIGRQRFQQVARAANLKTGI